MEARQFLNPGDAVPYEGISSQDRTHRVTSAVLYQIPVGRRGKWFRSMSRRLDAVVGGWQLSTIYIFQSGIPLAWGDVVTFGDTNDIRKGGHTPDEWFNIDAGFTRNTATRPASYHYRAWPFRFSNIRGPAMNNVDASINKRWRLSEHGAEFQVRAEALNAFNHVLFGLPQMDQFNSAFGQITTQANYARQVQLVLRASF
jgi:hypothetical protein